MKYSRDILIKENKSYKYLFFWGHQPSKDGSITKTCFSQWWESLFEVNGITYKTAEHWMMAEKARLFQDMEMLEKIIAASSPAQAKQFGREVKGFTTELWNKKRFEIVVEGNYHKFSQNEALKEFLCNTNDRILVEASPVDKIWGVGLTSNDEKAENPKLWKGLNLLGFALMEVRDKLNENNK
ncbi:NADAR family protein [Flavobacterium oreochromis]|uniref:NADAR family protein n=1 Tax=Flavobacterium oreochromis TaxID=2906078 RepID=UPI001CE6BBB6|nr:NADAR family protein [Flavobacterium oreochromis]QYS87464.1 NADAR family protein [Flavobacterium oreochromis]